MTSLFVTRLTAPLAVVSAILLVSAVGSALYVRGEQRSVAALLAENVASVRAAQELEISIREVRPQFDRYLITGDRRYLDPVPRLKQRTEQALAAAEEAANTPEEQALMQRLRRGYDHFFREYDQALQRPPAGFSPALIRLIDGVLTDEILAPAHEYRRLNEEMLASSTRENQEVADWLTVGLLGLGVCGSAGGLLVGWVAAASVRHSIERTEARLRDTAKRLDEAARPRDEPADPAQRPLDALDRVSASVSAILQRLRQTERDALRAERLALVGQMAAGIAHEVRNPLMTMKLLVQAAADRRGGSAFRPRELQILDEEIVRLEHIVSGFLDFARPAEPARRPIDLAALVSQSVDSMRRRGELQGVEVIAESPAEPVMALADPNQIRQVLDNLIVNSLDVQPQGGVCRVRLGAAEREVVLTVEDTGPGLPEQLGEQIFDPFVSTRETGLGLGLSICRRIVEAHAGTIRASNRDGKGAAFTLRLPLEESGGRGQESGVRKEGVAAALP